MADEDMGERSRAPGQSQESAGHLDHVEDAGDPGDAEDAHDEPDRDEEEASLADLSFDRAESDVSSSACTRCSATIAGQYYEADARVVCSPCARVIRSGEPNDSSIGRAARAIALGLGAAIVSAFLWWGIREVTDYELGIIAVAVGLAVGVAVRTGARGMGGWFYQALAMLLTYSAIVSTYVPAVMEAIRHPEQIEPAPSGRGVPPPTPEHTAVAPEDAVPAPIAFVIACIIAPAMPFLMGFENIIGILLIGFALWEAWRVNKRAVARLQGPYALARAEESAAA